MTEGGSAASPLYIARPFVLVKWCDASTENGWMDEEESSEHGVEIVWSSGWLVSRDRKQVKLVGDVGEVDNSSNRRIAIPMQMVIKIVELSREGEKVVFEKKAYRQG